MGTHSTLCRTSGALRTSDTVGGVPSADDRPGTGCKAEAVPELSRNSLITFSIAPCTSSPATGSATTDFMLATISTICHDFEVVYGHSPCHAKLQQTEIGEDARRGVEKVGDTRRVRVQHFLRRVRVQHFQRSCGMRYFCPRVGMKENTRARFAARA